MDLYLITKDYQRVIQTTELDDITGSDVSIRQLTEGSVRTEIFSYLKFRYDLLQEFQNTTKFSMTVIYKAGNRVYLDADAYDPSAGVYAIGALTLESGKVYNCTTAIVAPEAFAPSKWHLLGNQYDLFFVTYPQPVFDQDKFYTKGDGTFWKDSTYTAQRDSITSDHEFELQQLDYKNINNANVFPDSKDISAAKNMWGVGVAYAVAAGTLPTDATKWTFGDNRNQDMVELFMDIVIYRLCKRIAPQNVPEVRHNAWLSAIAKLKDFAKGNTDAQLPITQPKEKDSAIIIHGGTVKQINNW